MPSDTDPAANPEQPRQPATFASDHPGYDVEKSRVILIGASDYDRDPKNFKSLRAARHNLCDLDDLFADKTVVGIQDIERLDNRSYPELVDKLRSLCTPGLKYLIVYYVGHGIVSDDRLRLASANTTFVDRDDNAFPYRSLLRIVNGVPDIETKIVILDCCYSGRAAGEGMIRDGLDRAVLLAASGADREAFSPPGRRNTGLTGHLIAVMKEGLPNGRQFLTVRDVFEEVKRRCADGAGGVPKLDRPVAVYFGDGSLINFCHNRQKPLDESTKLFKRVEEIKAKRPALLSVRNLKEKIEERLQNEEVSERLQATGLELEDWIYENVHARKQKALQYEDIVYILQQPEFRDFYEKYDPPIELQRDITSIHIEGRNGDAQVTLSLSGIVSGRPLSCMFQNAYGDFPLGSFKALNLAAESSNGEVLIAPFQIPGTDPTLFEFLIVFVDKIPVGSPFDLKLTWSWKKMFKPLVEEGLDFWVYSPRTSSPTVPQLCIVFHTPAAWGRLAIRNTGSGEGVPCAGDDLPEVARLLADGAGRATPRAAAEEALATGWRIAGLERMTRVVLELRRSSADK